MTGLADELLGHAAGGDASGPELEEEECPECGRTFGTAQGLALHRSRTHGVRGKARRRGKRRPKAPTGKQTRRPVAAPRPYDRSRALALVCPGELPKDADALWDLLQWAIQGEALAEACARKGKRSK